MENSNRLLQVAIAAAKKAGRIQMRRFGRALSIEYKGAFDPVTEVDRLCDQAIQKTILDSFPEHDILTEETPFQKKGYPYKWIIDPLDGTTNYLHGFPCFCVSIGLEVEGEMRLGVIYVPPLKELFYAEKGKGAFLNGKSITVSKIDQLSKSLLATGFPYDVHDHADFYLQYFHQFIIRCFAIRRPGSAAIDLSYLAAGRFEGFWEFKLHPWDVAAVSLIVTEAGGRMTNMKGEPFTIYSDELLASNGQIHDEMLQVIRDMEK